MKNVPGLKVVAASEVLLGDQIPEQDGFLFDVISVNHVSKKTVDITLASDFSSFPSHSKKSGGITKRFRGNTKLYVCRPGENK